MNNPRRRDKHWFPAFKHCERQHNAYPTLSNLLSKKKKKKKTLCQTNHPNRQLINLNSKLTRRKGQRCSESNDSSGVVQNAWKKLMRTKKQIHVDLKTSSKSSSGKFFQPVSLTQSEVPN